MPPVRIDVVRARSQAELAQLTRTLHEAMIAAFDVQVRNRFRICDIYTKVGNLMCRHLGLWPKAGVAMTWRN